MTTPIEIVQDFYAALERGDAPQALALMSEDIEWTTMWHYQAKERGPQAVAEGLLAPLMAEWSSFRIAPTEFVSEGETVVSIGRFVGTHGTNGKTADAGYAHVWTVRSGHIARFRQYIDTKAVADARI
ncbi:nuclear transport factor 2 family protein [Burkholderia gladioli]|uniref:nuclear transport factor 2 family protein n=1 Tax=Burkholderia gladioli TaxID=28095 RepID=UPI001640F661|nr:nuclear transport factor 2 family protein [Burkholderia gladioli]